MDIPQKVSIFPDFPADIMSESWLCPYGGTKEEFTMCSILGSVCLVVQFVPMCNIIGSVFLA